MNKERKKGLVPALRFPEFKDAGEWEKKRLGEIGQFIGGGTPNTSVAEYWDGAIQWFTPTEIKQQYLFESKRTISNKGLQNSSAKLLPKGTLLLSTRATVGDIGIAGNECATNQGFQSLLVHDSEINLFWYYSISQNKNELFRRASGSTFLEIVKTEINKVSTLRPSKEEQQKIADCLSSLDELIAAHTKKHEALQSYKKGLMQNLFPAEGKTVPALRFPDFENAGEWEKKLLAQVCEVNPSVKNLPDSFVYIDLESVDGGILLKKSVISLQGAPSRAQRFLTKDDVIFQMVRPYQKNNYFFKPDDDLEYVASTGYAQLRAYGSSMYLFQYLHNDRFVNRVLAKCTGSNYPAINSSDFSQIQVEIPSLREQQKIADCLSSLDDLIGRTGEKIEALKAHKKGLMQQLFPAMDEAAA